MRVREERERGASHLHILVVVVRFIHLRRPFAVEEDLLGDVEVLFRLLDEVLQELREQRRSNVPREPRLEARKADLLHPATLRKERLEHRLRMLEQHALDCAVGLAMSGHVGKLWHGQVVDVDTRVVMLRLSRTEAQVLAGVCKARHRRHVPACPAARRVKALIEK